MALWWSLTRLHTFRLVVNITEVQFTNYWVNVTMEQSFVCIRQARKTAQVMTTEEFLKLGRIGRLAGGGTPLKGQTPGSGSGES
jgi:hypothetical protein